MSILNSISKFSWMREDIEILEEANQSYSNKEKENLFYEDINKRLGNVNEEHNDMLLRIQSLITEFELKESILVYKLIFVPELIEDDLFESIGLIATTINPKYIRKMILELEKEYEGNPPDFRIARIFIDKGISGVYLPSITGSSKEEGEFLLNNDLVLYVSDTSKVTRILGKKYRILDLTATFPVEEETYQKFKNDPRTNLAKLRKYDRNVKVKKHN